MIFANSLVTKNTYVFCGVDAHHLSYGCVDWMGTVQVDVTAPSPSNFPLSDNPRLAMQIHNQLMQERAEQAAAQHMPTVEDIKVAKIDHCDPDGSRFLRFSKLKGAAYRFSPGEQNVQGDGTVPHQSSFAPHGKPGVKRVFKLTGFSHQDAFNDVNVRHLIQYLIVKLASEHVVDEAVQALMKEKDEAYSAKSILRKLLRSPSTLDAPLKRRELW